jgi:hypothetical protein
VRNTAVGTIVSATGFFTNVSHGEDTVIYTLPTGCSSWIMLTFGPQTTGTITGPATVCAGSTIYLTDLVTTGTWSASNGNATVSGGTVTGVSPGIDTIYYGVGCALSLPPAMRIVTVTSTGPVAPITGPASMCQGSTIYLSDATLGGAWTCSSPGAINSTSGAVYGSSAGTLVVT